MNQCCFTGRLTQDVDYRLTENGVHIAKFGLAVRSAKKDKSGKALPIFVNCICFAKTAETVSSYCKKGSHIGVVATAVDGSYEKDGKKVFKIEFIVNAFDFLDAKKEEIKPLNEAVQEKALESSEEDIEVPF